MKDRRFGAAEAKTCDGGFMQVLCGAFYSITIAYILISEIH
jgi:hypothetical protein